jgi:hypothetical protein
MTSAPVAPPVRPTRGALAALRAQVLGVRPVSRRRRGVALGVAITADLVQLALWPLFAEGAASGFEDALDVVVALVLTFTLGMSPRIALAFALELVPGVDLFPTWTAVVLTIPVERGAPADTERAAR